MSEAGEPVPQSPEGEPAAEEEEQQAEEEQPADGEADEQQEEETEPQQDEGGQELEAETEQQEAEEASQKEQESTEEKEQNERESPRPATQQQEEPPAAAPTEVDEGEAQLVEDDDVDEEVELDENMNYMQELKNILEKFKAMKDESAEQKVELLKSDLKDYRRTLKGSKLYFSSGVTVTSEVRSSINEIVEEMFNKIKEEHRPFNKEEADNQKTRSELEAEEQTHKANAAKLKALERLQEIVALSAEVEESAAETSAELAKAAQLASQLGEATDALKQQMSDEDKQKEEGEVDQAAREEELQRQKEEEERLKAEEEERLKAEEEERERLAEEQRLAEEAERAKYEPTTWPVFSYKESDDADDVTLVIRAPPDEAQQEQFTVTVEDELTSTFKLDDNEELVSQIVHVKPNSDEPIKCSGPVWIACPHSFGRINYREPWLKICMGSETTIIKAQEEEGGQETKDGEEGEPAEEEGEGEKKKEEKPKQQKAPPAWKMKDHCRDTAIPDMKMRFDEAPFTEVSEMSIAVISRIKEDVGVVTNKGGKVASTVDTRCNINVPKGAFRHSAEFGIKLFPVDSKIMEEIKNNHNKQAGNLIALSPFVDIRLNSKKMKKPVSFSITNPGASRKRDQPGKGNGPDGKGAKPAAQVGGGNESLAMFVQGDNNQWAINNEMSFTYDRDVLTFKMETIIKRFILIRTQGDCMPGDGMFIIKQIIQKNKDVLSHIVIQQNDETESSSQVRIQCVKADKLDKAIEKLKASGFDSGSGASPALTLHEGQVITVKFRGNVNFDDKQERKFVYHSNRETGSCDGSVSVVDRYQQHALDVFRGHAQFFTEPEAQPTPPTGGGQKAANAPPPKPRLLCELAVELSKREYEPAQVNRAPVKIREFGPLTNDYLDELSKEMGDEWRQVAERLGLSGPSIQRITLRGDGAPDVMAKDMLITWYKTAKSSTDKVQALFHALRDSERDDLSAELEKKNHEFQVKMENRLEEAKWKKAYRAVTDSIKAIQNWVQLAQALEVDQGEIDAISQKSQITEREKVWEMLGKWREAKQDNSSRDILVVTLKKCKLIEASENVQHVG